MSKTRFEFHHGSAVALFCFAMLGATGSAAAGCRLTAADKAANAKLSFEEFDQKATTPSTWRALEEAGCHDLAVEAAQDYLINGPPQTARSKSVVLFHIAQSLALGGDNAHAAILVAAAMPADQASSDELDWPAYLRGTWAFLVKDKAMLDTAVAKMAGEPGDRNKMDADVLRGLSACFEKSYREADVDCRPKQPKVP